MLIRHPLLLLWPQLQLLQSIQYFLFCREGLPPNAIMDCSTQLCNNMLVLSSAMSISMTTIFELTEVQKHLQLCSFATDCDLPSPLQGYNGQFWSQQLATWAKLALTKNGYAEYRIQNTEIITLYYTLLPTCMNTMPPAAIILPPSLYNGG